MQSPGWTVLALFALGLASCSSSGPQAGAHPTSLPPQSFGRPAVLARGEGEQRVFQGRRPLWIKVDPQTLGSTAFSVSMEDLPPGDSIGVHKHLLEDEVVYIARGHLQVTLGDSSHTAESGGLVFIPRGTWIGFHVLGADTATILFMFNTPGFEKCLRLLSAPKDSTFTRPSPAAIAAARRECHQVPRREPAQ